MTFGFSNTTFSSTSMSCTDITILDAPVDPTDGANKAYVDTIGSGFNFHNSCYSGSTTNLNAIYNNGAAGVGATLTNNGALAAFSIDGVSPPINSRILVEDQTSELENGIYDLTVVGDGATAWVLTRSTDYDTPAEVQQGDIVAVEFGTVNSDTLWLQTEVIANIGVDSIKFVEFNNQGVVVTQYSALVGGASNTITSVAPSATSGIPFVSSGVGADPSFTTAVVAGGGTGATTLTANGILLGNGTSAISATSAMTNGQLLVGSTGVAPVASTIPNGTNISWTAGAGTLQADLSGQVAVANGGTGTNTLTDASILIGNGVAAITQVGPLTNGQLLIGSTGVDPVAASITAGTGITINNGAGSIQISASGVPGLLSINMQVFTANGTYTPTAGMEYCIVEVVGGGGGGGGIYTFMGFATSFGAGGGGGGGGGYARGVFSAATIGASQAVTIGSGGGGGVGEANGSSGGTSSLGALCIATGGSGGTVGASSPPSFTPTNSVSGGSGGTGTAGTFLFAGQSGSIGFGTSSATQSLAVQGEGGSSLFGGGGTGTPGPNNFRADGSNGTGYGGGGSGSSYSGGAGGGLTFTGGSGTSGIIVITEYI